MDFETYEKEMKRIDSLDVSFEERGYQKAPVLCALVGCTPQALMETIEDAKNDPTRPDDEEFRGHDIGAIRWCREQLEKGNEL